MFVVIYWVMWVLGDYVLMVEEVMVLFGLILVVVVGIGLGVWVFDVVVGFGNILLFVVKMGVMVIFIDLMFELLQWFQVRVV